MQRFKKRSLIVATAIVVVIFGLAAGVYYLKNRDSPESVTQNIVSTNPELEVELNPPEQVQSYLKIIEQFNSKNYAETIKLAQAYGRSEAGQSTEKLSAYKICINAARLSDKQADMEVCSNEVSILVNGIEDLDVRNLWSEQIKNAMSGTVPAVKSDGQEDGQR